MIIERLFSKKSNKSKDSDKKKLIAGASATSGGLILANTKTGKLTGTVTRYHDAPTDVIDKIKNEGLLAKFAEDPNNLTNQVLPDVDMDKKKGLVYTSKTKKGAFGVGINRAMRRGDINYGKAQFENLIGRSPHHKVLELEFDYDDLKNQRKIDNPELLGQKDAKSWYNKKKKRYF